MKKGHLFDGPLSLFLISELMTTGNDDTGAGAVSVFIGRVRGDHADGKQVAAIEYSAYSEMAEKEILNISAKICHEFPDVRNIVIAHSTGLVKAGEASLFLMVTAGHREQATLACRNALEMIKDNLPVWKKEIFEDSSARWKQE